MKYLLMLCLVIPGKASFSQHKKMPGADTAIAFRVFGACEQCKDRIENAVKIRGVKKATWDVDSKQLSLLYNPSVVSLEKIQNRVVAVGHDIDNKKAKDVAYNALPQCCHNRDMATMMEAIKKDTGFSQLPGIKAAVDSTLHATHSDGEQRSSHLIKGIVLEDDNKGKFRPLSGASIFWLGTGNGVLADSTGLFSIQHDGMNSRLVVSYAGYRSDTITITEMNELKIVLASNKQLKEVTVTSKQRATYINNFSPIRVQTMSGTELLKAACCNLSESFETNPSVDVSYNDAVTGSKQIQLLGLSGNYTQLTVENLPGPRGIATPLGLNSIAGPWIESIQLTKGVGSVANGYESIAGQINVELKKPENSEKLLANLYVNDYGKTDLNLNLSKKISRNWSTALLLHDDFLTNKQLDFNKDGFRDLPTGNTVSFVNRYKFDNSRGSMIQFGVKILNDKRTGGEVNFDPSSDKYTTNRYGLGINTERYEGFAKIGYVFPEKKYKSIGLQLTAISHKQDSYFGFTTYNAKQQTVYGNLIYQSIIKTTIHKFRAGLSFLYDNYDELYKVRNYKRIEIVPGVFGEYTFTPNEKFSAVVGLRADHNSLYGFFVTPRLNIRYEPVKGTTIRASVGRGQRTANVFAENTGVFVSARQVSITGAAVGNGYGLDPEIAWNKGVSIDQKFKLFGNDALFAVDFFRNDFTNQVVVDMEDPRLVKFYNLQGRSYSNSFQAELNMEPVKKFEVRLAYRYFDVKTTYSGQLLQRPLIAKDRAFVNLAYAVSGFKFDYTITYNGRKRLPGTKANIPMYQMPGYSPAFVLMNAQVSKTVGKKYPVDIYLGAENLANYFQKDVILAADQPFSQYFDASMIWGPVNGRMFYGGIRFKIK
ncbi:MAG: TonB-dependent receptor [Chitinophagaceae bacterium]|nr:TonB-dependent receptor [Chitinophagaceae bacterium]